jgi:hypothetical protein
MMNGEENWEIEEKIRDTMCGSWDGWDVVV